MKIIKSPSTDPAGNFALEKELLTERMEDFLLLYVNSPCVVVGRNQSIEAEVDTGWCALRGIPVLRRISGGGTVYHDGGNVNFAFITSTGRLPLDERSIESIIAALREMGVEATGGSRGELLAEGRKISGTASCVTKGRRLFHGTLLFDANLDHMRKALAGNPAERGRKVASVPLPTANLKTLLPGRFENTEQFVDELADRLVRILPAD